MTVVNFTTPRGDYSVSGVGYAPEGKVQFAEKDVDANEYKQLSELLMAAALCTTSSLQNEEARWFVVGTPTEGQLRVV